MGRLIDADAIVEYVRKYSPISDGADLLETWLEYAPTVDAVPVVRCKDCKHNPKLEWFGCPMASLSEKQRPETAWCWKGERKDGDGNE